MYNLLWSSFNKICFQPYFDKDFVYAVVDEVAEVYDDDLIRFWWGVVEKIGVLLFILSVILSLLLFLLLLLLFILSLLLLISLLLLQWIWVYIY